MKMKSPKKKPKTMTRHNDDGVVKSPKNEKASDIQRNSSLSPKRRKTKSPTFEESPVFDPSQDIFQSQVINILDDNTDCQLSTVVKYSSKNTWDSQDIPQTKEVTKKINKKKKSSNQFYSSPSRQVQNVRKDHLFLSPKNKRKLEDIVALNLSTFEDICSSSFDDTEVDTQNPKFQANTGSNSKEKLTAERIEFKPNDSIKTTMNTSRNLLADLSVCSVSTTNTENNKKLKKKLKLSKKSFKEEGQALDQVKGSSENYATPSKKKKRHRNGDVDNSNSVSLYYLAEEIDCEPSEESKINKEDVTPTKRKKHKTKQSDNNFLESNYNFLSENIEKKVSSSECDIISDLYGYSGFIEEKVNKDEEFDTTTISHNSKWKDEELSSDRSPCYKIEDIFDVNELENPSAPNTSFYNEPKISGTNEIKISSSGNFSVKKSPSTSSMETLQYFSPRKIKKERIRKRKRIQCFSDSEANKSDKTEDELSPKNNNGKRCLTDSEANKSDEIEDELSIYATPMKRRKKNELKLEIDTITALEPPVVCATNNKKKQGSPKFEQETNGVHDEANNSSTDDYFMTLADKILKRSDSEMTDITFNSNPAEKESRSKKSMERSDSDVTDITFTSNPAEKESRSKINMEKSDSDMTDITFTSNPAEKESSSKINMEKSDSDMTDITFTSSPSDKESRCKRRMENGQINTDKPTDETPLSPRDHKVEIFDNFHSEQATHSTPKKHEDKLKEGRNLENLKQADVKKISVFSNISQLSKKHLSKAKKNRQSKNKKNCQLTSSDESTPDDVDISQTNVYDFNESPDVELMLTPNKLLRQKGAKITSYFKENKSSETKTLTEERVKTKKTKKDKSNSNNLSVFEDLENPDDPDWKPDEKENSFSKIKAYSPNKKNPELVSSTPFPRKKGENSKFLTPSENAHQTLNKSANGDSVDESVVLEDIQCQMLMSENELMKLKTLDIDVDWQLSPLHRIDTGSAKNSVAKLREMLGTGHEKRISVNKFTKEDEDKIRQSWEEFSIIYDFDNPELFFPTEQKFGHFSMKERHKFKLFLAKYLPDRHLRSVYNKFVIMYSVEKKGRWSEEEDKLLLDIYHACTTEDSLGDDSGRGKKLGVPMTKIMMKALNRTHGSIYQRLKILLQNEEAKALTQKDIDWTPDLEGALVANLIRKTKVNSIEDLRYATIPYKVWRRVCTRLELPLEKTISYWKYNLYTQLYARRPVMRHILQIQLIKWFYNSDVEFLQLIDWKDVSRRAGDLGSCKLSKIYTALIKRYVPKSLHKKFRETATYLYENHLPQLLNKESSPMLIRKEYDPETQTVLPREEESEEECLAFKLE